MDTIDDILRLFLIALIGSFTQKPKSLDSKFNSFTFFVLPITNI